MDGLIGNIERIVTMIDTWSEHKKQRLEARALKKGVTFEEEVRQYFEELLDDCNRLQEDFQEDPPEENEREKYNGLLQLIVDLKAYLANH
jgi:hypothetical protein